MDMKRMASRASALSAVVAIALGGSAAWAQEPVELSVGFNAAVDSIGVVAALEQGYYEDNGLNVTLAPAFSSGVEALNALQAGDVQIAIAGIPFQGAVIAGMDVVYLGSFTGNSTQVRSDGGFSIVAREGSGIDPKDPTTFRGKKLAATMGATSEVYATNFLTAAGLKPGEYELVNTVGPDMPAALAGGGVDAVVNSDPWPIISKMQSPGAYDVVRGGNYVANVGNIVATREFAQKNPELIEKFLTARAQADQWVRQNPEDAAETAVRYIPGTKIEVAKEAMKFVAPLMDGRASACTVAGLQIGTDFVRQLRNFEKPIEIKDFVMAGASVSVQKKHPELYSDLVAVPEKAMLPGDDLSNFDVAAASEACLK